MINGLDLFSGIGGLTIALQEWIVPIAYCENDRYAQADLLSRMSKGELPIASIWDDVRTLRARHLPVKSDIIIAGFPCQDISVAGSGKGLEGERSGLFFEIVRLAEEIKPSFIFLENVPAIRIRGLSTVGRELASIGYDCRWGIISAYDVGAPHIRKRWFCLAYSDCKRSSKFSLEEKGESGSGPNSLYLQANWRKWNPIDTFIRRGANGLTHRVDRIKCLGNAVVPCQAREAFKRLMGITG